MSKFDVVGFGALNVDKLFKVDKIAAAEEESFVMGYQESCGGSAANTMVGLARLGYKTGFIGKVGDDSEGKLLIDDFREEGVDVRGITVAPCARSGKVMGFVDQKGDRALYVEPGVNDTIDVADIDEEYACQAKFLHLTSFVGKMSFQTQRKIVERLPEGVKVSFDPGALYSRMGLVAIEDIVRRTFVFMPNAGELELLTGKSDYRRGAESLIEIGVSIVAVKLGGRGCYVTDGKREHSMEAFRVKVVDTTGAGDAFCAGFLYGLVKGRSLENCGQIGNFVASRCIMKMGARTGLPTLKDLRSHGLA